MRGAPSDNDKLSLSIEYGDVSAAAHILNLSESYLNKARVTGAGPPYAKFGKSVRYHLPSALAWAAARTRRSTSDNVGG
jgi:hypothetical protein